MTPFAFVAKWRHVALSERAAAQTHFIDLCALVGHKDPVAADPDGTWFTFERGATKAGGGEGWADVWKRGFFGFEYKGKHKDLDAAYWQLLKYQGALENPPLLVACDTDRIVIHTHFANTPTKAIELTLEDLVEPDQLAVLRAVFHDPERLRPEKTIQQITEEAAGRVTEIAQQLRARGVPPERVARFLDRVVFCMFAEDVELLPSKVFSRVIENTHGDPVRFKSQAAALFECMAHGGDFGPERIEHFNGNLFDATEALDLTADELKALLGVCSLDWTNIDPSIFGTLFERALDPDKRSQLGAHYTSREDIETIVDPVVMAPLRREWEAVRAKFDALAGGGKATPKQWKDARALVRGFLDRLASVTVLDPACGSGNFLFVTLQKLKDLEKEVIVHASRFFPFFPQVGPWQLHGIEVNRYAHELAQMTVWIGHLQWHQQHGMPLEERPILRATMSFACRDAVLESGDGSEPTWPKAEFIVSNPPFLGDKMMRAVLGDAQVDRLRKLYSDRLPGGVDLCCYWFEKARAQIATGSTRRVGLLATQGIRGGANRRVLERIKASGDIFFAIRDHEWVLDGASVHVSMVGFDAGSETHRSLDGVGVASINANLTAAADITKARRLTTNAGSFIGTQKNGAFDVPFEVAAEWLALPFNPNGRPNSDVVVPWANGQDLMGRASQRWVIDFGVDRSEGAAAMYEAPFEYAATHVRPDRLTNRRAAYRVKWWLHAEPRPAMRIALAGQSRYLVTPTLAKHRLFVWLQSPILPDKQLAVFSQADDVLFGILQSRLHEAWSRAQGTQLREAESGCRYTTSSTFETFPLPRRSGDEGEAIAAAARQLALMRDRWLNPPDLVREASVTFAASVDGPWARQVIAPGADGIGTATFRWLAAADDGAAAVLKRRTLTNLYNVSPTWLVDVHRALDEAVFAAYGWSIDMTDEQVLSALLELNLQRAEEVDLR